MAYEEGQYINQFLNTMPQQLLQHSQYKEGQRQFDESLSQRDRQLLQRDKQFDESLSQRDRQLAERTRQFDISSKQRAKESRQRSRQYDDARSLREKEFNLRKEADERKRDEKALLDLIVRGQHKIDVDKSDAQARKNTLLEDVPLGTGLWKALPWTETVDEWAQREAGFPDIPDMLPIPEGEISLQLWQLLQSLPAYHAPIKNVQDARMNLLNMTGGQ
jgi:hypothetical protein